MFMSLGDSVCTSTTIPLPMMASTESLRALERNAGIWCLLKHNWRQLLNFVPGLSIFNTKKCVILTITLSDVLASRFDFIVCFGKFARVVDDMEALHVLLLLRTFGHGSATSLVCWSHMRWDVRVFHFRLQ